MKFAPRVYNNYRGVVRFPSGFYHNQNQMFQKITFLFALLLTTHACLAQSPEVRPTNNRVTTKAVEARKSPLALTTLRVGDSYAKIVYSQPHLRGRTMLGNTISYDQVWRLGANEATEIFTTADLKIGDKILPAGAYSVFAIPTEKTWTLIFNKGLGQWGAYTYDESLDQLRVDAKVLRASKPYEAFNIWFEDSGDALNFAWGNDLVTVPVSFVAAMRKPMPRKE